VNFNPNDLLAIAPEIALVATAAVILLIELIVTRSEAALQTVAMIGLVIAGALAALTGGLGGGAFNGMVATDGFSSFLKVVLVGVAALTVMISRNYFQTPPPTPPASGGADMDSRLRGNEERSGIRHGEYYALLLLTTLGMMVLATAISLVTLFLGVETMSVGLYLLAGLRHEKPRSSEAALKYLLLGAFASGFLLYGMALIYGATGGNLGFGEIAEAIHGQAGTPILLGGVGLLMVGLLFKVAAAPFHFWSPDVYQGAPTPVTAFMSAGPKAAAMAVTLRLFGWGLPDIAGSWGPVLWVVAALTMTIGNVVAISQKDIKRMLAYSSISHAGYLLLAVLAAGTLETRDAAASGMMFYLAAYYLMNLGAFTVAIAVSRGRADGGDYQIDDYQGLAAKNPVMALAMALFMISLAGIPPTAGFFGKLFVFTAAVKAGYVGLVVIAVLNSVVSAFYYLRIVVFMYMKPQTAPLDVRLSMGGRAVAVICAAGIMIFGLMPSLIRTQADKAGTEIQVTSAQVVK